jgi:hypothetical protein
MKPSRIAFAVLALGIGYSTAASAQGEPQWLKDRRYGEGIGIRTGDLELHPGIGGEFGYDSNYFLRSSNDPPPNGPVVSTLRFRITPSFSLATISPQRREAEGQGSEPPKVTFRTGVAASYNEFIATDSANSDELSKQRNVGVVGNLQLVILPNRPWGADIFGDFVRTPQPSNNPDFNYNRFTARFGGGVTWAPGGGMFDWRLGYQYQYVYFEQDAFRGFGNHTNEVNTRGRWRFLPRTAFMYDASIGFIRNDYNTPGQLNSDPVRARVGLNGLVTSSLAFLGMVGWGASFYEGAANAQQFDSVIAQAELKWYITPNPGLDPGGVGLTLSSLAAGYTRDFFNSYLGDYFTRDRGYLSLVSFFSQRVLLVVDGGVASLRYPNVYNPQRQLIHTPFNTTLLDGSLFAEYRFSDSVGLNTTVRYSANLTDTFIVVAPGALPDYLNWNRFEAYIGLRWFM